MSKQRYLLIEQIYIDKIFDVLLDYFCHEFEVIKESLKKRNQIINALPKELNKIETQKRKWGDELETLTNQYREENKLYQTLRRKKQSSLTITQKKIFQTVQKSIKEISHQMDRTESLLLCDYKLEKIFLTSYMLFLGCCGGILVWVLKDRKDTVFISIDNQFHMIKGEVDQINNQNEQLNQNITKFEEIISKLPKKYTQLKQLYGYFNSTSQAISEDLVDIQQRLFETQHYFQLGSDDMQGYINLQGDPSFLVYGQIMTEEDYVKLTIKLMLETESQFSQFESSHWETGWAFPEDRNIWRAELMECQNLSELSERLMKMPALISNVNQKIKPKIRINCTKIKDVRLVQYIFFLLIVFWVFKDQKFNQGLQQLGKETSIFAGELYAFALGFYYRMIDYIYKHIQVEESVIEETIMEEKPEEELAQVKKRDGLRQRKKKIVYDEVDESESEEWFDQYKY